MTFDQSKAVSQNLVTKKWQQNRPLTGTQNVSTQGSTQQNNFRRKKLRRFQKV